jgi:hypothetical protein
LDCAGGVGVVDFGVDLRMNDLLDLIDRIGRNLLRVVVVVLWLRGLYFFYELWLG